MKYIKTYKSIKEPQVGDYVLFYLNPKIGNEELRTFFNANIAQVIKIDKIENYPYQEPNPTISILYEYVPPGIIDQFDRKNFNISLPKNAIVACSKNKEDLEPYIIANKYNI